jgi:2'-5' RNA ligase
VRLFVAFEVPPALRAAIAERLAPHRAGAPRARWVSEENLHLSLVFLGERPEATLAPLGDELAAAFAGAAPISLRLRGVGSFPGGGAARVLWLGVEAPPGLAPLQGAVATACRSAAGVEPETRPYHPHVTLARCDPPWPRRRVDELRAAVGDLDQEFTAAEGMLFRSTPGRGGARYSPLARFPLRGVG